ncbi:MAG: FAD-dependent oxidoreductase [Rhodospirillales bacterium]|nr:FAD-dependent oxidoreductase [Rhodospirillales bacterium]
MFDFLKKLFGWSTPAPPVKHPTPAASSPPTPVASSPPTPVASAPRSDIHEPKPAPPPAAAPQTAPAAANGATRYVIVGAGPAGVIAAETIRKLDGDGDVLVIHGDDGPPYSRMAIPYFLSGHIDEAGTHLRKAKGFYDDRRIRVQHGRVEGVAPSDGRLTLAGNQVVPFDRLLIATGSSPIRPPIEGSDLPGVHTCWTMADAANIVRLAEAGSHVVLLGAGFIGSIILESLVERRVNLTVVELGDRMVPRMMNATAGSMLKRWCESKGVNVRTSTSITRIERARDAADNRDTLAVELSDGHKLPAHLVIIAAGVSANMGFLNGSGIKTDAGILADSHLRTNHSNIFAAGDVAQGPDFSTGGYSVHAVQPTAADHGRIAAINMTGGSASFKGSLIMNVLDTVGLVSCSFGNWQGVDGGEQAERVDEAGFRYANLQFADDRLIGAITLGRTDWVGVLRGLIQTEVPLGPWKEMLMADPHRIAEAFIARVGA